MTLFRGTVGFDDAITSPSFSYSLHLTNERALTGNWAIGPAGTNEYDWWFMTFDPFARITALAESWEMPDPNTIIFHIRKGIHYGLNPQSEASRLVNGREMTAQDVAFCMSRSYGPRGYLGLVHPKWLQSATATDKWTVVVKGDDSIERTVYNFDWIGQFLSIYPPELVAKYGNLLDWKNSVGTGPFMLMDYIPASSLTFERNPNYWGKDPVGPGKGNQLPYLDGVMLLTILDKSTRLAALRTAKLDHLGGRSTDLTLEDQESLLKTTPQLKYKGGLMSDSASIFGRMDKPELPFKDIRVRKALLMAIDYKKIKDEYYRGQAEILPRPIPPVFKNVYTPLEELPESTRELYSYNPDKAKQLLAEAGYPNGFKTSILCQDADQDILAIVVDYWSKIGVDARLDLKDPTVFMSQRAAHAHKEMVCMTTSNARTYDLGYMSLTRVENYMIVNDTYSNEVQSQLWAWENVANQAKRDQLVKEWARYILDKAYWISLPCPYVYNMWWPWVKNYHGENQVGYAAEPDWVRYAWLDQDLKKEMTGRK